MTSAVCDSAVDGMPADDRSNVGLSDSAPSASRISTRPEAAANTAGRRPRAPPIAVNAAPFGSRCHAFDGQNTAVPISDTTAGISVRAAMRVTATAIARVGPSDRKMLSDDSVSARKAAMTTQAAEAMTSPTRVTDWTIASFLSSPRRSRSR